MPYWGVLIIRSVLISGYLHNEFLDSSETRKGFDVRLFSSKNGHLPMAVPSAVVKNTWRGMRKAPEMIPNRIKTKLSVSW